MNVIEPKKERIKKRTILIYATIASICILAIAIVISIQVLGKDMANQIFGVKSLTNKTQEQEQNLKDNFDHIFQNTLEGTTEGMDISKINKEKDLVYTGFEGQKKVENSYDIKVAIPYLNIDHEVIKQYNKEISKTFKDKVISTLNTQNKNIIYTVEYQAHVQDSILSVMIRSSLKQGASAQRVIIQTYHFDLQNKKQVTLKEILEKYGLQENEVENKIRQEIAVEQQKAEDLQALGYNIFTRDSKSDDYKIESAKEFFIYQNNIYILYAYGNDSVTSEMDLVIL